MVETLDFSMPFFRTGLQVMRPPDFHLDTMLSGFFCLLLYTTQTICIRSCTPQNDGCKYIFFKHIMRKKSFFAKKKKERWSGTRNHVHRIGMPLIHFALFTTALVRNHGTIIMAKAAGDSNNCGTSIGASFNIINSRKKTKMLVRLWIRQQQQQQQQTKNVNRTA